MIQSKEFAASDGFVHDMSSVAAPAASTPIPSAAAQPSKDPVSAAARASPSSSATGGGYVPPVSLAKSDSPYDLPAVTAAASARPAKPAKGNAAPPSPAPVAVANNTAEVMSIF